MPIKGKHRRSMSSRFARRLVAAGTGGAALAIPLVAATTAEAAPSAQHAATETAVTSAAAQKDHSATYTVVSGDSLAKIAREHSLGGGWKKLYKENRQAVGSNPSLIHPGLALTLGGKAAAGTADKSSAGQADPSSVTTKTENTKTENTKSATTESATTKSAPAENTSADSAPASQSTYSNDLDGWIRQSLDVMAQNGIPGTYDGIYRNIMRESSGNPQAINGWDSNAAAGTPSKGLLQVIDPTFQAYHVPGTSMDSYDPVANITAACNYAAAVYGSIDNVNGPY
jgi:LysM repeat protein